jgi:hypothetical protein
MTCEKKLTRLARSASFKGAKRWMRWSIPEKGSPWKRSWMATVGSFEEPLLDAGFPVFPAWFAEPIAASNTTSAMTPLYPEASDVTSGKDPGVGANERSRIA